MVRDPHSLAYTLMVPSDDHSKVQDFETYKFRDLIEDYYKDLYSTSEKCRKFTRQLFRLSVILRQKNQFLSIASDFARISEESQRSIVELIRLGHLSEAQVLCRWQIEGCHLLYFLFRNPNELDRWLNNEWIRPKNVGKFIASEGKASWKDIYDGLSNIVHFNSEFTRNHARISQGETRDVLQEVLVGQTLLNICIVASKLNDVMLKAMMPYMGDQFKELDQHHNELSEQVLKHSASIESLVSKFKEEYGE